MEHIDGIVNTKSAAADKLAVRVKRATQSCAPKMFPKAVMQSAHMVNAGPVCRTRKKSLIMAKRPHAIVRHFGK